MTQRSFSIKFSAFARSCDDDISDKNYIFQVFYGAVPQWITMSAIDVMLVFLYFYFVKGIGNDTVGVVLLSSELTSYKVAW